MKNTGSQRNALTKHFFALMAFAIAFGASSRVFGFDSVRYEQKEEVAVFAVEHYEAVCD